MHERGWVRETSEQKTLATKAHALSLISGTQEWRQEADSLGLSSDLHRSPAVWVSIHMHTRISEKRHKRPTSRVNSKMVAKRFGTAISQTSFLLPVPSVSWAVSFIDRRCESSRLSCLKQVHFALVINLPGSCRQNIQSHYMKHVHYLETAGEKRPDWLKPGILGSGELPGVDGVSSVCVPLALQPKDRKTAFPCALGSHTVGLNHWKIPCFYRGDKDREFGPF